MYRCRMYVFALAAAGMLALGPPAQGLILNGGGLEYVEEGGMFAPQNLSMAGSGFAVSSHPSPGHDSDYLNDLIYGNNNSWLSNTLDPASCYNSSGVAFGGISFGGSMQSVQSIAFGRDNTGGFPDRYEGLYTLQYTQMANPDLNINLPDDSTTGGVTAATGWESIGTIKYMGANPCKSFESPWLRHRFNFDPVEATGVRLLVSDIEICIDEIELYSAAKANVLPPPSAEPLTITSVGEFTIDWDGNDGLYFDDTMDGPPAPANLATGKTAFASSELSQYGYSTANVNDGAYGNNRSWIANFTDTNPYVGIDFGKQVEIGKIAFGRDNGSLDMLGNPPPGEAWQFDDRWLGTYTIEVTMDADPQDPGASWTTVGDISYSYLMDDTPGGELTPYYRHEFDVAQNGGLINATGLRIKVSDPGACLDEIEVYGLAPEPGTMLLLGLGGLVLAGRRRKS